MTFNVYVQVIGMANAVTNGDGMFETEDYGDVSVVEVLWFRL